MPAPIALQLYTVRQELEKDFAGTLRRIADIGYIGVEPAVLRGVDFGKDAVRIFKELGLVTPSTHGPLPLGEHKNQVLDMVAQLGCKWLVCSMLDRSYFTSRDQVKRGCDLLNAASAVASANGFSFGYHNHWWEFEPVEGSRPFDVMLNLLDPAVFIELDTYWAQTAGADPVAIVAQLGDRAPLLHLKDGSAVMRPAPAGLGQLSAVVDQTAFDESYRSMIAEMVPLGEGSMHAPAIIEAGKVSTEWLIVELDACNVDMVSAVERSYDYLVGEGLARGNR